MKKTVDEVDSGGYQGTRKVQIIRIKKILTKRSKVLALSRRRGFETKKVS